MKILILGYLDSPLIDFLVAEGNDVLVTQDRIDLISLEEINVEFLLSYGYRHIIGKDVIDRYKGKLLNLHISYLPYNKGADPNFWSFVESTPAGVTIHEVDEGVDTGRIIAQERVYFNDTDTLRSSYVILHSRIQDLFRKFWPAILERRIVPREQKGLGTFHRTKDKLELINSLGENYLDIPFSELRKKIDIHHRRFR